MDDDQRAKTRERVAALRARRRAQGLTARGTRPVASMYVYSTAQVAVLTHTSERTAYRTARKAWVAAAEKAGLDRASVQDLLDLGAWTARDVKRMATAAKDHPDDVAMLNGIMRLLIRDVTT